MKVNENTALIGSSVVLVPYRSEHVKTYHEWMKDPELLELTASEPLTLDQEVEMQQRWHLDNDKLTCIILARRAANNDKSRSLPIPGDIRSLPMIGDVNMFFKEDSEVECEVMIAERPYRRQGMALEALQLFLRYATTTSDPSTTNLPVAPTSLVVRIGASNMPSIALFQKLGFSVSKHVDVFDQVEMKFAWDATKGQHFGVEEWVNTWGRDEFTVLLYE